MRIRVRVPINKGALPVRYSTGSPVKWTPERRRLVAIRNNNNGQWYSATGWKSSIADLERRFAEGSVSRLLYDVVGGIAGDKQTLFLQILKHDRYVDVCLDMLGIKLQGTVQRSQVRFI